MPGSTTTSDSSSTIVSILTPTGRSAIATIVIWGKEAVRMALRHFRPFAVPHETGELPVNRIVFGVWSRQSPSQVAGMTGEDSAGEEVVICRRPDTAEGQEVEVHCHGGSAARSAILRDLESTGARFVAWPDWVRRTSHSETIVEAQLAMANAKTMRAAKVLLDQRQGALQLAIDEIISLLSDDADIPSAAIQLGALLKTSTMGRRLASAWRIAIVGPPNAGKSSLINAILGYQRSIVHDVPGTTRDVLTATTAIDGWPVQFSDTAGIRTTDDPIEKMGVALARDVVRDADCAVVVFDASVAWDSQCDAFLQEIEEACALVVIVQNKIDLLRQATTAAQGAMPTDRPGDVGTSASQTSGIDALLDRISQKIVAEPPAAGSPILITDRQVALVTAALESLSRQDCQSACQTLSMMQSLAQDG